MSARKTLVIASNLHVGGGVQVAASLINEWAGLEGSDAAAMRRSRIEVSPAVWANLGSSARAELDLVVRRRRPLSVWYWPRDLFRRFDLALVVFGPTYFPIRSRKVVGGYADVTSLYEPAEYLPGVGSVRRSIRSKARKTWSLRWARQVDGLIVETEAIGSRLRGALGASCPEVRVIPNCVNRAITESREPLSIERDGVDVLLAYPARGYAHKNLEFLPKVVEALHGRGSNKIVRFVVTLTETEWQAASQAFREVCINVGPLRVEDVGSLMRACDAVFFPSLLEAQSATPLEALATGRLLFASDRDFVRATCASAGMYFDPANPTSAADILTRGLAAGSEIAERARKTGLQIVEALPTPAERARQTWEFASAATSKNRSEESRS